MTFTPIIFWFLRLSHPLTGRKNAGLVHVSIGECITPGDTLVRTTANIYNMAGTAIFE